MKTQYNPKLPVLSAKNQALGFSGIGSTGQEVQGQRIDIPYPINLRSLRPQSLLLTIFNPHNLKSQTSQTLLPLIYLNFQNDAF